jgi:hypothetical protein
MIVVGLRRRRIVSCSRGSLGLVQRQIPFLIAIKSTLSAFPWSITMQPAAQSTGDVQLYMVA